MAITATATITVAGTPYDPIKAIEDAIHAWVVRGSGLAASNVIWGDRGRLPTGTFIALRFTANRRVSSDWLRAERTAGGAIIQHARGTRHPTLELEARAAELTSGAQAGWLLERVLAARTLPTVQQRLQRAGVGVGTIGPVRVIPGVKSQMFDPRATVEVGLHTMITVSEAGSAIESVDVETPGPVTQTLP